MRGIRPRQVYVRVDPMFPAIPDSAAVSIRGDLLDRILFVPTRSAAALCMHLTYEELTAQKFTNETTITLLRVRCRDLRAVDVRMELVANGPVPKPFEYNTVEGGRDTVSRVKKLNVYVAIHVQKIEELLARINREKDMRQQWIRANHGSANLIKEMRARSRTVVDELFKREYTGTMVDWASNVGSSSHDFSCAEAAGGVRMSGMSTVSASALQHSQVPYVFDERTARGEREDRMAEARILKPSRGEIFIRGSFVLISVTYKKHSQAKSSVWRLGCSSCVIIHDDSRLLVSISTTTICIDQLPRGM